MKPINFKAINNERTKIKGINVQTNSESVDMGDNHTLDYYHQNKYFSSVKTGDDGKILILNAKGETLYSIEVSGSGTSFNTTEGNPVVLKEQTLYHKTSGVTKGSYGEIEAKTPAFGESFKVPNYTVDEWGHITSTGVVDVVIPSIDDITQRLTSLENQMSTATQLLDEINGEVI